MQHIREQQPGGRGNSSGGERKFVAALARAACAVGVAGLFMKPIRTLTMRLCGPNMIQIDDMPALIAQLRDFDALRKGL